MSNQVSNNSNRERILLAFFPSAIALAIYSIVFALPVQRTQNALESEFRVEQSNAVPIDVAENSQQMLSNEKASYDRLKERISNSKQQTREMSQVWRARNARLETLEKVSELMRDFNLSIVKQSDGEEATVSRYTQELFQLMDTQHPNDPIKLWQVEVKGSYLEVVEFMTAVDKDQKKIVPIGISMEADEAGGAQKKWTIVFAI